MPPTDDDTAKTPYKRTAFARDVYRSAFALSAILVVGGFVFGAKTGVGILAGTGVSLLFFWTLERTLRWIAESGRKRRRLRIVGLIAAKYTVAGALLYVFVRREWLNVGAFAAGLCVIYLSVVATLALNRHRRGH